MTGDPFDVPGEMNGPVASGTAPVAPTPAADDWTVYGGTASGQRYSTLADITPSNVGNLKLAWTFHTGDKKGPDDPNETTAENVPLKVGDMLYLCSKHDHVIALDPATGEKRWEFDPKVQVSHDFQHLNCRGLAYHDATLAPGAGSSAPAPAGVAAVAAASAAASSAATGVASATAATCLKRVILPSIDARLFALDATTGQPCAGFGKNGVVDLTVDIGQFKPGYYMETSPPVVTKKLIVIGGSINDNESVDNPSGVIRAFDVADGTPGLELGSRQARPDRPLAPARRIRPTRPMRGRRRASTSNSASSTSRSATCRPTSSAPTAARRSSASRSSVVALDLATGKLRWSFQGVHHDLWDCDMPAQPTSSTSRSAARGCRRSCSRPSRATSTCSTAAPGARSCPSRDSAVPASTCPTSTSRRRSPLRRSASCRRRSPARTCGARRRSTSSSAGSRSSRWITRAVHAAGDARDADYPVQLGVFDWGGVAVDPVRQAVVGVPVHMAFTSQLVPRPAPQPMS